MIIDKEVQVLMTLLKGEMSISEINRRINDSPVGYAWIYVVVKDLERKELVESKKVDRRRLCKLTKRGHRIAVQWFKTQLTIDKNLDSVWKKVRR